MQPEPIRYADPFQVIARAARFLRVPERMTVSACAERFRWLENPGGGYTGPWNFDRAPFLRRPTDCLMPDSGYSIVAVKGPGQCYKSSIGDNWMLWTVVSDPADMIMLGPDKALVGDYVVTQIDKMIATARDGALRKRLLDTVGADNIYRKRFVGSTWFFIWPVKSQLRQRPAGRFRVDDYDSIPEDIEGEGNAITLLGGRQATFEGFEIGYVNSSPALGADKGIEALVASGTDESWWTRCLQCDHPFLFAFEEVLHFKRDGTPEEARETAHVVCPECGYPHPQSVKYGDAEHPGLMTRAAWVGQGQQLEPDGTLTGTLRPSRIAGFNFDGLMGARSWGALAEQCRRAELAFERAQDEGELRAFYNAWVGVNYRSRLAGAEPIRPDRLRARAEGSTYRLRQVPPGVVFLTAAVDVQGNRYEVMVIGWGEAHQCWIVDRFAILALEDGTTGIVPHRRAEHWGVLLKHVIWRRYALAEDPAQSLPIVNTAIDTGGVDGATDNAFAFWHTARKAGVPETSITLVKGGNNPRARLLPPPVIDAKRRKGNEDPPRFDPNVHRMKDIIDSRLRREEPGPGYVNLPRDIEQQHLEELTAERREQGLWVRPIGARNETLDLMVYNITAVMRHGGLDGSLAWVPEWARAKRRQAGVPEITAPAVAAVAEGRAAVVEQPARPAVKRPRFRIRSGV